jgi:hypothetical protein
MVDFRQLSVLAISVTLISACTPANPLATSWPHRKIETDEVSRGVVNGVWQYDPTRNSERLQGRFVGLSPDDARTLVGRYQVRVGIDRGWFVFRADDVVVLPAGWTYSLAAVIDNGRTINVGDVVQLRTLAGTHLNLLESIVRKCDSPPIPGENKDWDIGCKAVKYFDASGYGGERYYLTGF